MLRLKPTELTLTPDDVDEAFRRIARRQQSKPPAAQAQRRTRLYGPPPSPPPPRLMPGAQRSVRDAITHLGDFPSLQPHQAIVAHVDDESDESGEVLTEPEQHAESSSDPCSLDTRSVKLVPTLSTAPLPSSRHISRLPFRLGRSRRQQDNDRELSASPKDYVADYEETPLESPSLTTEASAVAGPATPSRTRQNREFTADSSPARQRSPPTSPASLRGGASRPQRSRVLSVGQEALHAPSPLRHAQIPSSACSPDGNLASPDDIWPRTHLKGYFVAQQDPQTRRIDDGDFTSDAETTKAATYTFHEETQRAPHTEPFRRTSQPRFHSRSQSSSDVPPSRLFAPTTDSLYTASTEDVFWTAPEHAYEHTTHVEVGKRARQQSSEMSNTSLAFSYYELPENRHSSGEQPMHDSLSHSQHDGVEDSRYASRGTYRSFKLSDGQPLLQADNPSVFPVLIRRPPEQQNASPLPAEPYERPSAGYFGTRFQQAVRRYVSSNSSNREVPTDAMVATMEERASPLDVLEAQIERASHHLEEQHGRQLRRSHPESGRSAHRNAGPGTSTYDRYPFVHGVSSTFEQSSDLSGLSQSAFGTPMAMADDPYTRGVSASLVRPHISPVHPIPAQHATATSHVASPYARDTHGGRGGQRSSENTSVSSSGQVRRTGPNLQVQDHVLAFEQMQHDARPRHTRRQTEVQHVAQAHSRHEQESSPIFGASIWGHPRHSSRQATALSPGHGNAGRRSARTNPRLQDQENSGEAEVELMRRELDSVRMRYDEGEQGDVMDETPPRIGRVERHM